MFHLCPVDVLGCWVKREFEEICLGLKFQIRLRDLGDCEGLYIRCALCLHEGFLMQLALLCHHPPHMWIRDLEGRMRCSECGNRTLNGWTTVRRSNGTLAS